MSPVMWGHTIGLYSQTAVCSVFADGTVQISTGGIEIGQGLNTKVAQAVAMTLGIDLSTIEVLEPDSRVLNGGGSTSGSVASELCVGAALLAAEDINAKLAPVRTDDMTFVEAVAATIDFVSGESELQLIGTGRYLGVEGNTDLFNGGGRDDYATYGVCCVEAEIDVLTGEMQIL